MAINDRTDYVLSSLSDQEDEFRTALGEYVWNYYRNYTDAVRLENDVVKAMEVLLYEAFPYGDSAEKIIARAEASINRLGGVIGSEGDRHKVATFPDYVFDDDED